MRHRRADGTEGLRVLQVRHHLCNPWEQQLPYTARNILHLFSQSWPGPEPTMFSSLRCCSHPPVPSGSKWIAFLGSEEEGTLNAEAMIRLQERGERSRSDFLINRLDKGACRGCVNLCCRGDKERRRCWDEGVSDEWGYKSEKARTESLLFAAAVRSIVSATVS